MSAWLGRMCAGSGAGRPPPRWRVRALTTPSDMAEKKIKGRGLSSRNRVPCFLSGGQYTAEQAIRNRAIATNRYVIEVTYSHVKAWKMLSPVVGRKDFPIINDVWWWALGFSNMALQPLKRPFREHKWMQTESVVAEYMEV